MVDESQNIQSEFISEMFRYIRTHEELLTVDIFNIVFQFIFFRAVPQSGSVHFWNSVLEENYVNSLYCTDNLPGVTLYAKLSLLNSPARLSEITESNEWQFYFGLRLGKDEEWADVNLVKEVIDVLTEKYSKLVVAENYGEHVGHILILLGYLARYDIGVVKLFFDKNPTVFTRDGLCFIRSNIKEHEFVPNIIPMQKLSKGEVATFAFRFINDEAEKAQNYSAKEKEFSNLITEKVSKLMTSSSNNDSNNEMEKIRSHLTVKQQEYERTWISMWRSMTLDRAPWNSALPPSSRKVVRFKRDNCICTSFCPYKLRRNFNFDDHKEASMIRDKGSKETVKKEMARQIKRHLSSVVDLPDFIIDESNESRPILSPSKAKQVEISDSKSELSIPCRIISMKKSTKAKIFLFYDKIVIKKVKNKTTKQIVFLKKDIDHIFYRPFQGKLTAIEIFAKGRKSYFINFEVPIASKVQQIYSILNIQPKPGHYFQTTDFMSFFKSTGLTEKWVNHEISTFDYLMYLNVFSGRSFNVASQYPVFPWVLCDYSSKEIDLTNPKIYRDLSKPVGALNDERLKELKKKRDENEEAGLDSYLYSSGYSFPLSVYLFLLRVEPFTSLHINMQGGKFDYSARLFNSIAEAYNLVCNQQSDFRELIPEFFFMPEFLLNMNEFDLGFVNGEKVNNVSLPQWASDCFDFIYMNRKALESEYVSKNIPDWIDLIWGYKQSGEAAKDADNVFRPELYSDIWEKEAELSEEEKKLISITLDQVGQIPHKLFNEAHPKRKETNRISNQEIKTLNCPSNIDGFSVSRESKRSLMFFVYDKRATKITRYDFELSRLNDNSPESKAAVVKLNNGIDVLAIGKTNKLIALERNCCVLLADDLLHVKKILIPSCDASIIESHVGIVTCAVDGPYTVLAGNDAALLIYSNNSVHPNIVRTYRNTITFIALSRTFDQVVAGTKDHSLIFCSLSRGSITCVVDLPKGVIANKILITKSMGFVLVDGIHPVNGSIQHVLYLYNINGNFIREIEINFDVACWCTYEDNSGFDFLFAADQDGNIYYYEVFFISNEIQPIYNCKKEVVSIYCFKDESTAVFSCRDGSIVLYPI